MPAFCRGLPGIEADNEIDYEDNVIFPSGKTEPLTISDWEWMFEAFEKAIEERGWANDTSAYCTTIYYQGFMQTGGLVSSFGGGTGQYYIKDGEVSFDGDSENFKTYLECLNTWYNNGWLDSEFNTRTNDMFFSINANGVNQGKVGMWDRMANSIGAAIRLTCQNEEDAQDAYVMGAALPINDVYGGEEQKYKEPDSLYQASRKGTGIVVTNKAKGKDLETLFTFFNWTYTLDGGLTLGAGLSEEQYAAVKLEPDLYAEHGLESAYTVSTGEDGRTVYTKTVDPSSSMVLRERLRESQSGFVRGVSAEICRSGKDGGIKKHRNKKHKSNKTPEQKSGKAACGLYAKMNKKVHRFYGLFVILAI